MRTPWSRPSTMRICRPSPRDMAPPIEATLRRTGALRAGMVGEAAALRTGMAGTRPAMTPTGSPSLHGRACACHPGQ
jgi:hypothetical protein